MAAAKTAEVKITAAKLTILKAIIALKGTSAGNAVPPAKIAAKLGITPAVVMHHCYKTAMQASGHVKRAELEEGFGYYVTALGIKASKAGVEKPKAKAEKPKKEAAAK